MQEALLLNAQGQYEKATVLWKALCESYPQSAAAHAMLGYVLWEQKELAPAIQAFDKAVCLSPTSELASLGLFHTLFELGDRKSAEQEMKRYTALAKSEEYEAIEKKWTLLTTAISNKVGRLLGAVLICDEAIIDYYAWHAKNTVYPYKKARSPGRIYLASAARSR